MSLSGESPDSDLPKQPWPWLMRAAGGQCRLSTKQIVQCQDAGWLVARFQDREAAGRLDKQAGHFADRQVAPEGRGLFEDGRAILPDRAFGFFTRQAPDQLFAFHHREALKLILLED